VTSLKLFFSLSLTLLASTGLAQTDCRDISDVDHFRRAASAGARPNLVSSLELSQLRGMLELSSLKRYGTLLSDVGARTTQDTYAVIRSLYALYRCNDGRRKELRFSAGTYTMSFPIPVLSNLTISGAGVGSTIIVNNRRDDVIPLRKVVFLSGATHPKMVELFNCNMTPLLSYPQRLTLTAGQRSFRLPNFQNQQNFVSQLPFLSKLNEKCCKGTDCTKRDAYLSLLSNPFPSLRRGDLLLLSGKSGKTDDFFMPYTQELVEINSITAEGDVTLVDPIQQNYVNSEVDDRALVQVMGSGIQRHASGRQSDTFMEKNILIRNLSTRGYGLMQESGVLRGRMENVEHRGFKGVTTNLLKDFVFDGLLLRVNWRGVELKGYCDSVTVNNSRIVGLNQPFTATATTADEDNESVQRPLLSTGERCRNVQLKNLNLIEGNAFFLTGKTAFMAESTTLQNVTYQARSPGLFAFIFGIQHNAQVTLDRVSVRYNPDPQYADPSVNKLRLISAKTEDDFDMTISLLQSLLNGGEVPANLINIHRTTTGRDSITLIKQ